jgi:hypothetical protein
MSPAEVYALLNAAFRQCSQQGNPLTAEQQAVFLELAAAMLGPISDEVSAIANPLDELSEEERRSLLTFIAEQDNQGTSWRAALLNDWLQGNDSGQVQFIRERYGPLWLDRITDTHINQYLNQTTPAYQQRQLKVGDRIEVSNRLWEWVKEGTPCDEEWVACTITSVSMPSETDLQPATVNCVVRFDNGIEYEIQGMNAWNAYSWRWMEA